MSQFAWTLISSSSLSVLLTGALAWLTRTWIGERLRGAIRSEYDAKLETLKAQLKSSADAMLETHKAQLKAQSDVELERLRTSLAIAAAERSVTHSWLTQRRFEAIAAIYGPLVQFAELLAQYRWDYEVGREASVKEQRRQETYQAQQAFRDAFAHHQIFLAKSSADRILEMVPKLIQPIKDLEADPEQTGHTTVPYQEWQKEAHAAMDLLETDLRMLMGDVEDAKR
ncbi:hypothetical protein [Paraburkholderia sp. BR10882]|uniref:hypothetical protein n=1 Tax=unclassified Paraburkholderia TaxID=2615204 RepID=UPI0034CDC60D